MSPNPQCTADLVPFAEEKNLIFLHFCEVWMWCEKNGVVSLIVEILYWSLGMDGWDTYTPHHSYCK